MAMRPDPTFHASPKLAMEAPPENFAYTLLLSPDFSKSDALAVIDVKPGSPTFSQIVHMVTTPYKGDEFWFNLDATWAFSLVLLKLFSFQPAICCARRRLREPQPA